MTGRPFSGRPKNREFSKRNLAVDSEIRSWVSMEVKDR